MYAPKIISYEKYHLSRIVTIYDIVSADYLCGTHPDENRHVHQDAWEICYCIQGEVFYFKEGSYITLKTGDILFTCPGVLHDSLVRNPDTIAFFISFTCLDDHIKMLRDNVIESTEAQQLLFKQIILELKQAFQLNEAQLRMFRFVPSKDSPVGAEQLVCSYLEQVFISILREITMQNGKPVKSRHFAEAMENYLISNVTAYIRAHIGEPLTVERIAEKFHYSRARLSTIYKASASIGINEFIAHERISRAKVLLLDQQMTVSQISEMVGFTSPQYFSRKFTQVVGCPPSQYADQREKRRVFSEDESVNL